ncbi:hypothetical protein EYV94_28010 [Puteibacter caeruleilacunae]|nr:hypothetical protein EYV94_28010 [Puteibacter caeruleilacunae]
MSENLIGLLLLVLCFIYSCDTGTEISYSYNNIEIKRIDKCGKTIFYYNHVANDVPKIWVEYSGINDGFSGYLKFEDNGKVSLLSGDGYFQSSNIDTSKFEYKRIMAHQRPYLIENVCIVQLSTRYEQEKNQNTDSKVKVVYYDSNK